MRRWALAVIVVLAATLCVRLGMWQLSRLAERRARNAEIERRLALPPVAIPPLPADQTDTLRYRTAAAHGAFDFDRQVVVMARSHLGGPAVHVVTPLLVGDSLAVLVERGWVASPDGRTVRLAPLDEPGPVTVTGMLLAPEADLPPPGDGWPRYVRRADPTRLGPLYPYRLLPMLLRRTEPPPAGPPGLAVVPLPPLDDGPHLSYAIQWFAFAGIAVVGGIILFRRTGTLIAER